MHLRVPQMRLDEVWVLPCPDQVLPVPEPSHYCPSQKKRPHLEEWSPSSLVKLQCKIKKPLTLLYILWACVSDKQQGAVCLLFPKLHWEVKERKWGYSYSVLQLYVSCVILFSSPSVFRSAQVFYNWLINRMHLARENTKLCLHHEGGGFLKGNCCSWRLSAFALL